MGQGYAERWAEAIRQGTVLGVVTEMLCLPDDSSRAWRLGVGMLVDTLSDARSDCICGDVSGFRDMK